MDIRRRGDVSSEQHLDQKELLETTALYDGETRSTFNQATSVGPRLLPAMIGFVFLLVAIILLGPGLPKIWCFGIISLFPVAGCFVRAATSSLSERRLMPLAVVATTVFAQLPAVVGSAFAAICIVIFSLITIPSNRRMQSHFQGNALPVLLAALLLVAILLTENFMVWVVSATFDAGQRRETAPEPLQDNGRSLIQSLTQGLAKYEVVGLRRVWNVQGALVACLGASFVLAEIYGKRQLYSLGLRAIMTLAAARTIRTISFLATVLPSQNKQCYIQHYPYPPPTDWQEWIWVGILPASNGGCNDLIISGHATVTSTLACISASVSDDPVFSASLWAMVVLDYMVEIYEGFHYSVDMWLGMVLVCLLWRALDFVESPKLQSHSSRNDEEKNKERYDMTIGSPKRITILLYSTPALVAFVQLSVLPSWTGNFLVVLYTLITAVLYLGFSYRNEDRARAALFQHMAQHTLYCLLMMAIGIYL